MEHLIPPSSPLRCGVIGLGGIWQNAHAPAIERLRQRGWDVRMVAGADPDPARRAQAEARFPGLVTLADGQTLIDTIPLDLLIIATWPPLTAQLAARACSRVPRLLVEKPVDKDPAAIQALAAAAAAHGTIVQVAYNRRSQPLVPAFQAALAAGGPVRHWAVRFWRGWRQEADFYGDVLGHPLSLLTAVAGPLDLEHVQVVPAQPIPRALVAHGRAGEATWTLDCRPATGLHAEVYEAVQDRRTVRCIYRPVETKAEEAGIWVAEDGAWRELPQTGPADVAWSQGFVHQLAQLAAAHPEPACTLADAAGIAGLIRAITAQAAPAARATP